MITQLGPVTVSDQVHKMIATLCRETDSALEDIELRGQSHSKWLELMTENGLTKILEAGCPPRKKVKFSIGESNKENAPSTNLNVLTNEVTPLNEDSSALVKIQNMKVAELRKSLKTKGLSTLGLKKELQDRLVVAQMISSAILFPQDVVMQEATAAPSCDEEMVPVEKARASSIPLVSALQLQFMQQKVFEISAMQGTRSANEIKDGPQVSLSDLKPLENMQDTANPPSNSPHFSEEVALPAIKEMEVSTILSPKKKHNALEKIMKATTKLFSPKRNKEQPVLKNDSSSPPVKEVDAFIDLKQQSATLTESKTAYPVAAIADIELVLNSSSVIKAAPPNVETYHQPISGNAFAIPRFEKPIDTRKLSVGSTTSTSSSSSSAKIQAIRKKVREEQALKIKEALSTSAPAYHSTAVKPSGEKPRFADIKEKIREQAKVNKVATTSNATNVVKAGVAGPAAPTTFTKTATANPSDDKKKILALQMREKAAAEALKKTDGIHPKKAAKNHPESVLMQIQPTTNVPITTTAVVTKPPVIDRPKSPMNTYEMSDREGSSSDDDSDSDEEKAPSKTIPEWAHKERLQKALEIQCCANGQPRVDPDEVFGEVYTCDLSAIFGESKRFNKPRKETGDWKNDKITPMEQMVYKRDMGYE